MVNYYAELGLDRSLNIPELEKELKALKKKWTTRAGSAPTMERRQEAERMVAMVREASAALLNKDKRAKYDKELDANPGAAQQTAPTGREDEERRPVPTGDMDLEDLVEEFYNSGNYAQALSVANKAIRNGTATVNVYRMAALCHIERGDNATAFRVLNSMREQYPEDVSAAFAYAKYCIQLIPEYAAEGHKIVQVLMEADGGEDNLLAALDVEYTLMCGDVELAEKKIQNHIDNFGSDRSFCRDVAGAFVRYADSFMTSYGGDTYFDSQTAYESWLAHTNRSLELEEDPDVRKHLNHVKEIVGGRKFLKDNWMGILCAVFYAYVGFNSHFLLGLLMVALAIAEVYFSIVPRWMLHRYNYTGHLVGVWEVFRIINWVLALLLRLTWQLIKLAWAVFEGILRLVASL